MRLVDRLADAEIRIDEALELAARDNNHVLLAKGYFIKGNLEWPKANYTGCIANHQASLSHAREASSVALEVQALGGLGDANYLRGRMITANENFVLCVKGADESGLGRVAAANRPMLAWCAIYKGELDHAWQLATAAREEARSISHTRAEIIALNALALSRRRAGRCRVGVRLLRGFDSACPRAWLATLSGDGSASGKQGHLIEGNREKSAECLREALDMASQTLSFIGPLDRGSLGSGSRFACRSARMDGSGRGNAGEGCGVPQLHVLP